MKLLISFAALAFLFGCSSATVRGDKVEYAPDKVLGRSDDRTSRPDWVKETVNITEHGDKVQFVGSVEVPGDSRATAAFKMSDAAARAAIAKKIETVVTSSVETGDTGLSMEDQTLKTMIKEVAQVSLKNVDVSDRYWEKAEHTGSSGEKSMMMKAFSLIEVKKDDLKKMMVARAEKSNAPEDMKNKVEEIIRSQWSNATP
jgi:hypothetical protein